MEFRSVNQRSLVKLHPGGMPDPCLYGHDFSYRGSVFSYQVAYWCEEPNHWLEACAVSDLAGVQVRQVENVPVEWLGFSLDEHVERREPGLYPDSLRVPTSVRPIRSVSRVWRSLWVTVPVSSEVKPGRYSVRVEFSVVVSNPRHEGVAERFRSPAFELEVLEPCLAAETLKHTEWFHCDCLADFYGVELWNEGFWGIAGNYFRNAVAHRINMLYTPLFTPPLDVQQGDYRKTTQLVGVTKTADGYAFDFGLLRRWLELALSCGYRYLEFSHLFTQWGAQACPKIMATVEGEERRIFGWDTPSDSPVYAEFLRQFIPHLLSVVDEYGLRERVYFHVADEPPLKALESYGAAARLLRGLLQGCHTLDAMSDVAFVNRGLVDIPVPATDCIEPFRGLEVREKWTYYCVCESHLVSNRFLHFPSVRNRIMGVLLYAYGLDGFLQWGFNFWMSNFSRYVLDPHGDSCSDLAFAPGDAYMVYPGPDGQPEDSIHYEVFTAGLQDHASLKLLEAGIGRPAVMEMLREWNGGRPLTMTSYPRTIHQYEELLNRIREALTC